MNLKHDVLIILVALVFLVVIGEAIAIPLRAISCRQIVTAVVLEPNPEFAEIRNVVCDPHRLFGLWDVYRVMGISRK